MHRSEFVKGLNVRAHGTETTMRLGGSREMWICSWSADAEFFSAVFEPSQLEAVPTRRADAGLA